jgi:hypothetical protein
VPRAAPEDGVVSPDQLCHTGDSHEKTLCSELAVMVVLVDLSGDMIQVPMCQRHADETLNAQSER